MASQMRHYDFMEVSAKDIMFWTVTPCSLVEIVECRLWHIFHRTSDSFYQTAWRNIPEDWRLTGTESMQQFIARRIAFNLNWKYAAVCRQKNNM